MAGEVLDWPASPETIDFPLDFLDQKSAPEVRRSSAGLHKKTFGFLRAPLSRTRKRDEMLADHRESQ